MNSLREQIANELDTFRMVANARSRGGDDPMDVAWEFVPRFMALIAEAMLLFPALKAAAGELPYYPEDVDNGNIEMAGDAIKLALAAAGITPGDAREGGEGE